MKSQILNKKTNSPEAKSSLSKNTSLTNSSENIFQAKRNALKGSSVNNLSNLLAQDDKNLALKNFDTNTVTSVSQQQSDTNMNRSPVVIKNTANSIKSLTLPTGKSSGGHTSPRSSNLPAHLSVRNLNFQLPNKTLSSSSNSSLNKSNSASDSSIQESKTSDLIRKTQNIFTSCLPYINVLNVSQRDVEDSWKLHVMSVFNKKSPTSINKSPMTSINMLETFCIFKRLFNESCGSFKLLLNESCQVLSINSKVFASISKRFVHISDLVNKKLKCPLVYFDQESLLQQLSSFNDLNNISSQADLKLAPTYSITDKHRQIVWEMGENYDLFIDLRKKAYNTLDLLRKFENKNSVNEIQLKFEMVKMRKNRVTIYLVLS
jgi:hypothetical protein